MLFQLQDVTKTYGPVTALDQLSVSVPAGAIGLLGPNGSGKTTLIRTLLGLISIDKGSGEILGMDFRRRQLDIRREVLDYVGLGEARYRNVESYSTGMKQRLKLASAIIHDPKLLILDEPTNGMDPAGREELLELSRDLARNKGMSLLFSSHLLPDVEAVCDYVVVLGSGKVLTAGNIQQLKQVHRQRFEVRLKADPAPFIRRLISLGCSAETRDDTLIVELPEGRSPQMLWEAAAADHQQIRHLRPQRSTLEEVFLKAVEQPSAHL
jgi:ABC-2 type transport system ATP-binding protein